MGQDFYEGDTVAVPCRHCGSLSITIKVRAGDSVRPCSKCHKETRFRVKAKPLPYEIRSEPVHPPEPSRS